MKDKYWEKDLSWLIKQMLYEAEKKFTDDGVKNFDVADELSTKYAHMINLWDNAGYGDIMTFDDFVDCVRCGGFTDWDGSGEFIDNDTGESLGEICCDIPWLNQHKPANSDYIMWYNK